MLSKILLEWSQSVYANNAIVVHLVHLEDDAFGAYIHCYHHMLSLRSLIAKSSKGS